MKTAIEVWQLGKPEDLTERHVIEIIQNMYRLKLAEAFFVGLNWIEGYTYCSNSTYLAKTFAPLALSKYKLQIWFACRFLQQKGVGHE